MSSRSATGIEMAWQSNVLVLSTKHSFAIMVREHHRGRIAKQKPTAVLSTSYNDHMQGIHLSGQMIKYYSLNLKTIKWWRKVFIHLVILTVINAQKLYHFVVTQQQGCSKPICDCWTSWLVSENIQLIQILLRKQWQAFAFKNTWAVVATLSRTCSQQSWISLMRSSPKEKATPNLGRDP